MRIENIRCKACNGVFSIDYTKDPHENHTYFYCVFCGCKIEDD